MTETLITVSARADGPRRPGASGVPLPGVRPGSSTSTGDDLPADGAAIGRAAGRGPTLFDGYLNRPDATRRSHRRRLVPRPATSPPSTRTARTASSAGRRTDLIKSGGYRIGAGEVEDALLAHPGVREAAVVGVPHPDLGQQVAAYVVGDGVTGPELIDFVARQLSVHKRPREVRLVDALPRNAMGKVQKKRLVDG